LKVIVQSPVGGRRFVVVYEVEINELVVGTDSELVPARTVEVVSAADPENVHVDAPVPMSVNVVDPLAPSKSM
jgi:flagellar biogenesis protein FliO